MRLDRRFGIVLTGVLALGLIGCQQGEESATTAATSPAETAGPTDEGSPQAPPRDTYTGALGRQQSGGAPAMDPPQAAGVSAEGRQFLATAAQYGTVEIQAARLAAEKARSTHVREFAKTMVENHSRVNDSLVQLAETKGVQIPTTPGSEGEDLLKKLRDLDGAQFDRVYAEKMLDTHQQAVRLFEQAAQASQDEDVRAFARTQLPTLRDHLRLAHSLPGVPQG